MVLNKNNFFVKILFVILFFTINAYSQNEFPLGSPYTAFGLGDMQYLSSTRTDAMGIQGISLMGNYDVNSLNPASNAELKYTEMSLSFKYGFLNLSKSNISDGNVNGVNIGIPLSNQRGMTLILGFNSLLRANYKIYNQYTTNDVTYAQTYAGNGGISRVNFGLTYKVLGGIYCGFEYNYAFGSQTKLAYLDFNSSYFTNTYIRKENNLTGSFVKGGLIFDLKKLTKMDKLNDFTVGFVYQSKMNLSSDQDAIYASSTSNDTVMSTSSEIQLPQAFGFGITKKIGKQLILSGDVLWQQWSKFISGNLPQNNYTNSVRYGLGAEISPLDKLDKSFWESITYRMGVFYDKSYFLVNNQEVNRIGVSAGLGIPLNHFNSIDLGVSYSIRGKSSDGLIQENYLKLTVGLNFGELWFLKPKDEDR
jgi:long-subunit fatty acid transport protein